MAITIGPTASVLGSNFSITSPVGTYQDTGFFVRLPSSSIPNPSVSFHISLDVRGVFSPVSGSDDSWITIKLVADDGSSPSDVPDSERLLIFIRGNEIDGGFFQSNQSFSFPISRTDQSVVIDFRLYAVVRGCSAGVNVANIQSNLDGKTVMSIERDNLIVQ